MDLNKARHRLQEANAMTLLRQGCVLGWLVVLLAVGPAHARDAAGQPRAVSPQVPPPRAADIVETLRATPVAREELER
ncbi:MAG: hypothetical protein VW687_08940 [Curvibacter sp.]